MQECGNSIASGLNIDMLSYQYKILIMKDKPSYLIMGIPIPGK